MNNLSNSGMRRVGADEGESGLLKEKQKVTWKDKKAAALPVWRTVVAR